VRRRAGARAGWWAAGLLIAGAIALHATDAQAANFSHLAVLPTCAAIVLARRGTARSAALAGVCLGLAVLTRQTWVIGVVPAAYAAWWHGGRRADRALALIGTMTLTILAIGIVVPFGGFFEWTFTSNGSLLFDLTQSHNVLPRALSAVELFLVGHLVLCWLAVRRGWRRDEIDLWLWLLTGLVAVGAGFRFFGHYWLQVLPPLCLLAAPAVARYTRPARAVLAAGVLLPTMWFWMQAWTPPARANPAPLVAEVREDTTAHQRIAVWGSFPEIYWESGRSPAGALVLSDFLVGKTADVSYGPRTLRDATPGALDEYMDSLTAQPPELFIDTSTAGIRGYGHYPVRLVPQVARFLRAHYRRVETVDRVALYRLRSLPRRVSARRTPR
jgi:4-amino-4-deoxy-L-arabinose transferase-like glycosyltransferase